MNMSYPVHLNGKQIDRFWSFVDKTEGCWNWKALFRPDGYGQFSLNNWTHKANRVSWVIQNGTIPDGLWVLHKCDNRACVRPDHLFLGTNKDNMIDCAKKGRTNRPTGYNGKSFNAKHTPATITAIREKYAVSGLSMRSLAAEYGVSSANISNIVNRRIWREV